MISCSSINIGSFPDAEAYFEVNIISAGDSENISLGITGTGVAYYGNTGNITRNGHLVSSGPRFGSFDTIGVGLYNKKVFFTYNGLLLRPLIPCIMF